MKHPDGRLLNQLPSIYRQSETLRTLLGLFEGFLFGDDRTPPETVPLPRSRDDAVSVEERIDAIPGLFDPHRTPAEFLGWLSQWVALSDYGKLPEARQRRLIEQIIPLYALRGTKPYLERLLALFTPPQTRIHVDDTPSTGFSIGRSRIGIGTTLAPERPYGFTVTVTLPAAGPAEGGAHASRTEWRKRLCRVIDLAKPVHTHYELECADDAYKMEGQF